MNGNHSNQIEYVDIAEWRKSVQEARLHFEAETKRLNELLEAAYIELQRIQDEEDLIAKTTRAYAARIETAPRRSPLAGNSLREVLIIHFANPDGVIAGKHATTTLYTMKYFSTRRAADGAVYTTLGKPPFIKVSKGVYRIPKDSPDWLRLRWSIIDENGHQVPLSFTRVTGTQRPPFVRGSTDLVQRVDFIRRLHPEWGVRQVRDELLQNGWDFQEKNPSSSVSQAFRSLKARNARLARSAAGLRHLPVTSPSAPQQKGTDRPLLFR